MKNTFLKTLVSSVLVFFLSISLVEAKTSCKYKDFQGWKDCFVKTKLSQRRNSVDIATFKKAKFLPKVIKLDLKQPESTMTFARYKSLIGIKQRAKNGKKFYKKHSKILNEISKKFGVEPEIIVALVAMESNFGQNQGGFKIIDSLATLAYEGRRKEFFEKELVNALTIAKNNRVSYQKLQGSWAGAMGQCQFMPSSYLSYAVDYDQDGTPDIWSSEKDVFASAANYLSSKGWKPANNKVKEVKLNSKGVKKYKTDKNHMYSVKSADFSRYIDQKSSKISDLTALRGAENLIFLKEDGIIQPTFIVGSNVNVLLKWNRSYYFVLSVMMIADELKRS